MPVQFEGTKTCARSFVAEHSYVVDTRMPLACLGEARRRCVRRRDNVCQWVFPQEFCRDEARSGEFEVDNLRMEIWEMTREISGGRE